MNNEGKPERLEELLKKARNMTQEEYRELYKRTRDNPNIEKVTVVLDGEERIKMGKRKIIRDELQPILNIIPNKFNVICHKNGDVEIQGHITETAKNFIFDYILNSIRKNNTLSISDRARYFINGIIVLEEISHKTIIRSSIISNH